MVDEEKAESHSFETEIELKTPKFPVSADVSILKLALTSKSYRIHRRTRRIPLVQWIHMLTTGRIVELEESCVSMAGTSLTLSGAYAVSVASTSRDPARRECWKIYTFLFTIDFKLNRPVDHDHSNFPGDHRSVTFVGRPFPLAEAPEHLARLRRWGLSFGMRLLVSLLHQF